MRSQLRLAAIVVSFAAACGGNVVVDGMPGGEAGAGGGTAITNGDGGSGASCAVAPPAGTLSCSLTSDACGETCLDASGNDYSVSCEGTACRCSYNGFVVCTCAGSAPACGGGSLAHCCPSPWP